MQSNEGKACDAVLRHLEAREGAVRSGIGWPEEEHHSGPVELICYVGSALYALEHTCIEPFEGLIRLNQEAERVFGAVEAAISVVVPDGEVWVLRLPALGLQDRSGREIRQAQKALTDFIKSTAPALPLLPYAEYRKGSQFTVTDVPFPVTLHRFRSEVPSHVAGFKSFFISHVVAGDKEAREAQRQKRIEKACNLQRFGKLAVWKKQFGARTVLILENTDLFLTNEIIVAEAYIRIVAAGSSIRPDEAYLLDTSQKSRWDLWPLQIGEQTFFDIYTESRWPLRQFTPSELVSVTNR